MKILEIAKSGLDLVFYNNTLGDYALAFLNLVALVIILSLSKRLLVSRLDKLAKRTLNDFDDFLVSLLANIGAPVFLAVSLCFVTLPLEISEEVRRIIRSTQVLALTIQAILTLQEVVKYGITKFYHRTRPNDPASTTVIKNLVNIVR